MVTIKSSSQSSNFSFIISFKSLRSSGSECVFRFRRFLPSEKKNTYFYISKQGGRQTAFSSLELCLVSEPGAYSPGWPQACHVIEDELELWISLSLLPEHCFGLGQASSRAEWRESSPWRGRCLPRVAPELESLAHLLLQLWVLQNTWARDARLREHRPPEKNLGNQEQ